MNSNRNVSSVTGIGMPSCPSALAHARASGAGTSSFRSLHERENKNQMRHSFFETEGIAILTMLMSRYRVSVKEEPQFAGETLEQCRARVTASRPGVTQTCVGCSVVA